jgi:hypothetical protein
VEAHLLAICLLPVVGRGLPELPSFAASPNNKPSDIINDPHPRYQISRPLSGVALHREPAGPEG